MSDSIQSMSMSLTYFLENKRHIFVTHIKHMHIFSLPTMLCHHFCILSCLLNVTKGVVATKGNKL